MVSVDPTLSYFSKPLKLLDHELSVRELVSSDSVKHVSSPQKVPNWVHSVN